MISIITPTYNREVLIRTTIQSILDQTYTNWELIIVDDGSTDNTEQALQPYLADSRIRYIKKQNSGQAASLNVGVSHAKGEFIVFLDSDDEAYPNWLQAASRNLQEDTGILCAAATRKFPDGTMINEDLSDYRLFGKQWKLKFTCGSLFIRREVFLSIGGYDAELKANIQTDLGYRLLDYLRNTSYKVAMLNEYLVQINAHDGERIRNNWRKRRDGSIQFINKHYKFIAENDPKEISNIYSSIAFSSYKLKARGESVKFLLKAIRHNPLRGINYVRVLKYAFM